MAHPRKLGLFSSLALAGVVTAARYVSSETRAPSATRIARRAPTDGTAPAAATDVALAAGAVDRGRLADTPTEIPAKGWKDILWRTYEEIGNDRVLAVAAGVVFYGLLALFPAITALVSLYALVADAQTINDHLAMLAGLLPSGSFSIVQDQVGRVLAKGDVKLGTAFLFSFALAIWSANGGMKAVIDALNVVYGETETRGFVRLNAVSLAFTFGGILAMLAAIGLVVAAPIVLAMVGLGTLSDLLLRFGRWPALAVMILLGLAVLYRFAPSRRAPQWRWISVGSVAAAAIWLIGSAALSYYLANYGAYDAAYGSLGAAIGLMIWMWMSTIVVLVGAELNSEIEHQTARDSTEGGAEKPIGTRGAKMADSVGGAR
jgi:membrane protein